MVAIEFSHVSKAYRLTHERPFLAKDILRRLIARPYRVERHEALRDVSFTIERGETVGVIGGNGSGKSTLLSLAAQTSYPTSGEVTVNGRVGPLLELGAGFHPLLTGLENIVLNASLLGMSEEEVAAERQAIIDYSELEKFIDAPITTYSTGMIARLGFAVLAHMRPEILLIDEALSVGDARFHAKCEATMREFIESGATIMLVSHDLHSVASLCRTAIWIEAGRVRAQGPVDEVVAMYQDYVAE